jgi:hypothetical protein
LKWVCRLIFDAFAQQRIVLLISATKAALAVNNWQKRAPLFDALPLQDTEVPQGQFLIPGQMVRIASRRAVSDLHAAVRYAPVQRMEFELDDR